MNSFFTWLMVIFLVAGAIDRIIGNRFGLGAEFEKGILTMGSLALGIIGIMSLTPILADLFRPIMVPIFRFLGADPGMFPGTIIGIDSGGAALSLELAEDRDAGLFGGLVIGSMLGNTMVFVIPASLSVAHSDDQGYIAQGILPGIITIPLGALVGGLAAGFSIGMICRNLLPVLILSLLIVLGLWKAERFMFRAFSIFGRLITIVNTVGLTLSIIDALTGIALLPGMIPLSENIVIIGNLAVILAGAFPLVYVLQRFLQKPLLRLGQILRINEVSITGLGASLVTGIVTFGMLKDMDNRGKILNMAFSVSAVAVLGSHLAFTANFSPKMLFPVVIAKLTAGISAVCLAALMTKTTCGNQ